MQEEISLPDLRDLAKEIVCDKYSNKGWDKTLVYVPAELELAIYVNRQALVTILCTPSKLNCLVIGYLYAEGIISGISDIASMRVCNEESLVDVMLNNPKYELPTVRTIASGCGGSGIFKTQGQNVNSGLVVTPMEVLSLMKQFQKQMVLYRFTGGVHTSALSDTKNLLVVAEDIGRHNALNKIHGECLLRELSTRERLLLTTGRISSEMLLKAAKMQVPVVVSRHSPTGRAISLARDLGIALVGEARGSRLSVFSHQERLGLSTEAQTRVK
ncbi:MAG: formate dehydrogenase accessory sulfurtransferase FdhD [Planctomycetota bacterium]